MAKLFGTDGIRGKANYFPMTPQIAMKVGMAVGLILKRSVDTKRVVIGKDTRLSCYMIENALVAGFTSVGVDAFLLGPIPTPAVAMLCRSMRADVGVMISASHNPYYDNGIKIFGSDGFKFSASLEQEIEEMVEQDLSSCFVFENQIGRVKRVQGDIYRYIEFVKTSIDHASLSGLRVVVDCANGAAYKAAPTALWELGADIVTIHDKPDGFNINHLCGSTHPSSLIKKVCETRADVGIALDGDADRMILVDEKGHIIDGDQVMATLAQKWLQEERLRGDGVVATIMSNLGLERFLNDLNLTLHRTAVGDRHVVSHMRDHGFNVGGEQSGHIILSDFSTTGDGLIAALQILAYAKQQNKTLSDLCHKFEKVPQISENIYIKNRDIINNSSVQKAIKDAEEKMSNQGRVIVRLSGTEPLIRIMIEGDDLDKMKNIMQDLKEVLQFQY